MNKTILITGAGSGLGKLIAKKFHKEGWNVIASMRSPEKETELTELDNVLVSRLDVTDKDSITKSVAEGLERFGNIDVLVNNAGYGLQGPFEVLAEELIRKEFEVNVFGLFNVTKAVLPHFRRNRAGIIINFSSIGGLITFPFTSMYHASKYAVEAFTEGLQYELNPIDIKLKLIEPGSFNTGFVSAMERESDDIYKYMPENCVYRDGLNATMARRHAMMGAQQDPQDVADIVFLAATDGSERLRYMVGDDAEKIYALRERMNDVEFKKMIMESFNL
ncbi:SDR family oxidoreductase [Puteibacter caeruleilacunae]|nr:SDR family oxidoreductase [Puteibacter caeruleilacunae]